MTKHMWSFQEQPPQRSHQRKIGDVDPKEKIDLTITLAGPKLPGPNEATDATLTPDEFLSRYGAKQADANKVANTLKKFGITVESVSLATRSMRIIGTAAAIKAALK